MTARLPGVNKTKSGFQVLLSNAHHQQALFMLFKVLRTSD